MTEARVQSMEKGKRSGYELYVELSFNLHVIRGSTELKEIVTTRLES